MYLRAPSVPLITCNPNFSVWSPADRLTDTFTTHWSGRPQILNGYATVDGITYRFMGHDAGVPAMKQTALRIEALYTQYTFEAEGLEMDVFFLSPLIPDDPDICSRPVSYLYVLPNSLDGEEHSLVVRIEVSEQICLDKAGQYPVRIREIHTKSYNGVFMGSKDQPVLQHKGDDCRIDYGYFYLCSESAEVGSFQKTTELGTAKQPDPKDLSYIYAQNCCPDDDGLLFLLAYDDIYAFEYFGTPIRPWWSRDGKTIRSALREALTEFDELFDRCERLSDELRLMALNAGGEKYADLVCLSFRQVVGAHELAADPDGKLLFISKENYSGGLTATVDVSYPSMPLFLWINPELVRGMMRPVYRFARSDAWPFDFAPHDVGLWPVMNGQVYAHGTELAGQMPVEECGNMLIMETLATLCDGNTEEAREQLPLLKQWARYLLENGEDPANQLCTDDFAGHLAHNCNLSLKAILGLYCLGVLLWVCEEDETESRFYVSKAREMAESWVKRAAKAEGGFRLAFDKPDSFSMKYNMVWDKLLGAHLFPDWVYRSEIADCLRHVKPYGLPLDSRRDYTKSDWLVWTATLCDRREDFDALVDPLWKAYHTSQSRVPMTDWYDTVTAAQVGFQCRTVQGGLFIKVLADRAFLELRRRGICEDYFDHA